MRDAAAVGDLERGGRGLEQREDLVDRARGEAGAVLVVEDEVERLPFEPLEDHVREPLPVGRGEGADVARLDDRRRAAGERSHELALLDEAVEQPLALILRRVGEDLEAFDRDRLPPDRVLREVDDAEAALAHGVSDLVFVGDQGAADAKRIATR